MKSVYIIVLNYNHYEDTIKCLDSLKKVQYDDMHVVVVDNDSNNDSVEQIKAVLPDDWILTNTNKNLGYAGGNNVGIRYAIENGADYICILNNDTVVKEDFLEKCIEKLDNPVVGFVGPVQINMDDDIVQCNGGYIDFKRGSTPRFDCGKIFSDLEKDRECDFIIGACLVCRASLLDEIGLIPEVYFLNYEETEWCYSAIKKGYKNLSIVTTNIRHKGSASINDVSGLGKYLAMRNQVIFMKRNSKTKSEYHKYLKRVVVDAFFGALHGDKHCKEVLPAYIDGMIGRVNRKRFPFIVVNDGE